jgi:hypothetical protein
VYRAIRAGSANDERGSAKRMRNNEELAQINENLMRSAA